MGSHHQGPGSFTGNFAMAGMSLEEFEHKVIATCSNSPIVQSAAVFELKPSWIRLRIFLIHETFVDVFYSEGTGKHPMLKLKTKSVYLAQTMPAAGAGIHITTPTNISQP